MKPYYKSKRFYIGIYKLSIKVTVVDNIYEYSILKKYINSSKSKENHLKGIAALVYNLVDDNKYEYSFDIVFQKGEDRESTIVHECFHICAQIMNNKGSYLTDSSEEAYAYLLEYLYTKIRIILIKFKLS